MKKKTLYWTMVSLLGGLSMLPTATQAQVNLKSIGIGVSYWRPSLDYWNKRSMLTDYNNGRGATLSGAAMPTASLEAGLTKGLSASVRVGYWKQSASGTVSIAGIDRTESFTLSLIPVSLDLKYCFTRPDGAAKTPFFTPYIGVGLSRYFIKNEFSRQVVNDTGSLNESQAGSDYGVQAFAGIEKRVVKKLYAGVEVRYHAGGYKQSVRNETGSTSESVRLNGLEAGLSLRFKLAN